MSFSIPNTFVAGTKARADEVNENFSSIEEEINRRNENLANIIEDVNSIKTDMFGNFIKEAKNITKTAKSKFCINYSNILENEIRPDILEFEDNILSFKIGGIYPKLTVTNANGDSKEFENLQNVDISGYGDGKYYIFLTLEGEIELFNTRFFKTPYEPKNVIRNDI